MPIKINGQTTGSVTLAAPATGSDVSLTLPTLDFGKVIQVVSASYSTQTDNNTSTFADTGLSATITPKSASSNVLVMVSQMGCQKRSDNSNNAVALRLLRGASVLSTFSKQLGFTGTTMGMVLDSSFTYLDSPATTSATTYKTQFANFYNGTGVRVQYDSSSSTITLIELAA